MTSLVWCTARYARRRNEHRQRQKDWREQWMGRSQSCHCGARRGGVADGKEYGSGRSISASDVRSRHTARRATCAQRLNGEVRRCEREQRSESEQLLANRASNSPVPIVTPRRRGA